MNGIPPTGLYFALMRRLGGQWRGAFLTLVIQLLTVGCATKGDLRDLQEVITEQEQQQNERLVRLVSGVVAEIEALQDTLRVQSDIAGDTRGGVARELRDVQDQLSQLTALTGQIQRTVTMVSQGLEADRERGVRVAAATPQTPDSLQGLNSTAEPVDPAAAEETYQAAMTQFNRGSVNTARRAFESLLADYPDHRLAPSSQFFLADILEQENRLDEAIEGFLRVAELYPTADRVPQALYRIGAIYELQGNLDQAIIYLERVVNTYPDSGVGDLARELLREIR
ncbi:MAG: tetratricopeptide repeat protein [Gemmatimonadota bacterium]|uniref:Uncharacterized protein n=1 Tax=marine metagenome TaxID=408172 RepID=A0A382HMB7_9ZZZZ|nr:tetratricopeptide repeat protein [Gemmatimonadota bacterium]